MVRSCAAWISSDVHRHRDGMPVGALTPLHGPRFVSAAAAVQPFTNAPRIDAARFRADLAAIRQLAAAAGVAPGHASAVVEDLIMTGLVTETPAGRSSMVAL